MRVNNNKFNDDDDDDDDDDDGSPFYLLHINRNGEFQMPQGLKHTKVFNNKSKEIHKETLNEQSCDIRISISKFNYSKFNLTKNPLCDRLGRKQYDDLWQDIANVDLLPTLQSQCKF
ncbi:hypothetical protein GQX74_008044 [Glossina fuscipes]|nr:hypothetical protein GQX74_008044 [Glossina fuscipes]